ncbi:MAG: hypothetical protein HYY13_01750 [Nitrospirae bacterium]|nr:hypothetical protein [Nitrospirota bacterium]
MDPVVFKKYKNNRRLYDTARRRYVNLDQIETLVRHRKNVHVVDAKTGRDLTNSVLLQIILNRARAGPAAFLPTDFLVHLIQHPGKNVLDFYRQFVKVGSEYLTRFQKGMGGTARLIETAFGGGAPHRGRKGGAGLEGLALRELHALRERLTGLETKLRKRRKG